MCRGFLFLDGVLHRQKHADAPILVTVAKRLVSCLILQHVHRLKGLSASFTLSERNCSVPSMLSTVPCFL